LGRFIGRNPFKRTFGPTVNSNYLGAASVYFVTDKPAAVDGYEDGMSLYLNGVGLYQGLDPSGYVWSLHAGFQGSAVVAAGPLPIPGTGWVLQVTGSANAFNCCEGGKQKLYYEGELEIELYVQAGGSFSGKEHSGKRPANGGGSRYRDPKTGRYTKGPKTGQRQPGSNVGSDSSQTKCPEKGISGYVIGYLRAEVGAYWGVRGVVEAQLYPNFEWPPSFNLEGGTGIYGASLSGGVRGGINYTGSAEDFWNLF
jgi:hypothetical protein